VEKEVPLEVDEEKVADGLGVQGVAKKMEVVARPFVNRFHCLSLMRCLVVAVCLKLTCCLHSFTQGIGGGGHAFPELFWVLDRNKFNILNKKT
jgi:hypothetical protein